MSNYAKYIKERDEQSRKFIQAQQLKDRFLHPFLPTIIVDNFYEEPDLWRDYALDQEFFKGDRGTWPGVRTKLLHELDMNLFRITYKKMLFLLRDYGFTKLTELSTGFQSINETYGRGWVHDDDPKFNVAGIIYLDKTAPDGSGTTIYEDSVDYNSELYTEIFLKDVLDENSEERKQHAKYREEQVSKFTPTIVAENVYNRCVMFDCRCWHSANNFFGNEISNARLTQVFFIKAE